ncbi:hypothetical protein OBP_170 [Pseudomonas phage OBP]|uniref:hypothetical protein n=1 Tax=Pseudomonas phage OBP TaxID=1124849 RepID=UPI000240D58A|nr:hypothetical protein OBP_170 [Pseudomonas phage OBP]AEV89607.1 hypothetical protein OBP_170 [Pseudomonas phage OBP]
MSITKIRSGVRVSGSLKTLDMDTSILALIKTRLRRLYSEADQSVFAYIINPLVTTRANQLSDDKFRARVKSELLKHAQMVFPDRNYTEVSDYSVLYNAIVDFIKERNDKISAYQRNK